MKNWKAALVFLCIFICGAVAGGFVGLRIGCQRYAKEAEVQKKAQPRPRFSVEDMTKRRFAELKKRLKITDAQQAKIEPLFKSVQVELRKLREQSFQQTNDILNKYDEEVMKLLDEEQRAEFLKIVTERQKQFEKAAAERAAGRASHAGGPPPPPPGGDPRGGMPPPPPPEGNASAPEAAPAAERAPAGK